MNHDLYKDDWIAMKTPVTDSLLSDRIDIRIYWYYVIGWLQ